MSGFGACKGISFVKNVVGTNSGERQYHMQCHRPHQWFDQMCRHTFSVHLAAFLAVHVVFWRLVLLELTVDWPAVARPCTDFVSVAMLTSQGLYTKLGVLKALDIGTFSMVVPSIFTAWCCADRCRHGVFMLSFTPPKNSTVSTQQITNFLGELGESSLGERNVTQFLAPRLLAGSQFLKQCVIC